MFSTYYFSPSFKSFICLGIHNIFCVNFLDTLVELVFIITKDSHNCLLFVYYIFSIVS